MPIESLKEGGSWTMYKKMNLIALSLIFFTVALAGDSGV